MELFKEFKLRSHVCSVPGCRNRQTFKLSRSAGAASVLFLCRGCIAQAFAQALSVDTAGCRNIEDVASAVALSCGLPEMSEQNDGKEAEK